MNELQLYKEAFDSAKNSIVITDSDANILYANKFFCEITGHKKEEVIGENPRILQSGYHSDAFYNYMWDILLSKKAWSGEMLNKKKNGELYWERVTITPILDEEGKITNYLAVKEDITREKSIEEALIKSEKKYRDIFEKSKDPMLLIDNGVFVDCNKEAWKILEYNHSNEIIGKTPAELSPEYQEGGQKSDELARQYVELVGIKQGMKFEWIHQKKNGQSIPVEVMLTKISDNESKELIFVVWRDITGRKKYEHSLKQALNEKNILLEEVHHRVKNNLAIIIAFLQIQIADMRVGQAERLTLERAITRIYSIANVHELLYEEKKITNISVKNYFDHLIDHILKTLDPTAEIEIYTRVNDVHMNVNELTPLGMLMNELLTNSIKYAFKGKKKGRIDLQIEKENDQYSVLYMDNGSGLRNESIESATTSGLKIVQLLLQQLGAEYRLLDDDGFGLTFRFKEREKGAHSNLDG